MAWLFDKDWLRSVSCALMQESRSLTREIDNASQGVAQLVQQVEPGATNRALRLHLIAIGFAGRRDELKRSNTVALWHCGTQQLQPCCVNGSRFSSPHRSSPVMCKCLGHRWHSAAFIRQYRDLCPCSNVMNSHCHHRSVLGRLCRPQHPPKLRKGWN